MSELMKQTTWKEVCTIPLVSNGETMTAILLERHQVTIQMALK